MSYDRTLTRVETYFDKTATRTWERLTSDAPVSRIRETVRRGRDGMRAKMLAQLPEDLRGALSVPLELRTDVRTLGFAAAVALVTALIFGLTPALRSSRVDMATALRAESAGSGGSHRTLTRSMLAAVQIAVSVVLLVGAMLLVRTLRNAYAVDPGFTTEGVLVAETNQLPGGDPAEATLRTLEIRDRIEALPGVEAASWSWWAPLQGGYPRRGSVIQYYEPAPGEPVDPE